MRRIPFLLLMISLSGLIVAAGGQKFESYALAARQPVQISIDHYQQRDGLTPVFINAGELQIMGYMDKSGQVFSQPSAGKHREKPLLTIDIAGGVMAIGQRSYPLATYEANAIRTRMRVTAAAVPLRLDVDWAGRRGEIILGETRLPLSLQVREKTYGIETIRVAGPNVMTFTEWIHVQGGQALENGSVEPEKTGQARTAAWVRQAE